MAVTPCPVLTEIALGTLISNVTLLPPGTLPAVTTQVVTLSQFATGTVGEPLEGRLVGLSNITLTAPPATFVANTNYTITDGTGTGTLRIDGDTNLAGTVPPASPFSFQALVGQFDNAAPFDSGYQLLPNSTSSFGTVPVELQSFSAE